MYIYKISNFRDKFGQLDYKNIDIKGNYGQLYPLDLNRDNYCVVCNDTHYEHEDITTISEKEYQEIKDTIDRQIQESSINEEGKEMQELETAIQELAAAQSMKNFENEQALMELTMMITMMGGI